MSDPSEEPGLTGDIRRILSGIRTLQLDVVAIKAEQTALRTDVMAQLDPKEAVRKDRRGRAGRHSGPERADQRPDEDGSPASGADG